MVQVPRGRVGRKSTGRVAWQVVLWLPPEDKEAIKAALKAKDEAAGAVARRALCEFAGIPDRDDEPKEGEE